MDAGAHLSRVDFDEPLHADALFLEEPAERQPAGACSPHGARTPIRERAPGEVLGLEPEEPPLRISRVRPGQPLGTVTPAQQDFRQAPQPIPRVEQLEPQGIVFWEIPVFPAAGGLEGFPSQAHGGVAQRAFDEARPVEGLGGGEAVEPGGVGLERGADWLVLAEQFDARAHAGEGRVGLQGGHAGLQPPGQRFIIGVHAGHIGGVRVGERELERGHEPPAAPVQDGHPSVLGGQALENPGCPIRGAILHREHPNLLEGSLQQAFHRPCHRGLGIAGGKEDGDDRGGHRV
ncbi:uncharacterized protein STAUR_2223 [Stigmatella aurantiaca DW4/3-1]|uniref:Uncharacterized protein n=1 Tax=Stigmatella aurantiaca (strain DW4/3-1) TaxID=378806 RepID=E3FCA4_STIAD|nr:uncharacterized protein STAUR_2223 [Stigmatella aurantiaca DW4/3-1]